MRKVSLGSLVNIRTGKLDANASNPEGKYPFFTCSRETLKIDTYSYDCECVLVAGNGDLNVKYYNGKFDAYQRTYIIESIDKNILNVKYLYYFMQLYVSKLRQMSIGGVIKYIKLNYLTDAKIPLPNIEKQNKIVKVLEKAQELIDKRKAQIEALDQLTQSVFLEMFGDPVLNPNKWDTNVLGSFLLNIDSGWSPKCEAYPATNGEWGVLKLSAVTQGIYLPHENKALPKNISPREEFEVKAGDILFTRKNTKELVGACAYVFETPKKLMLPDTIFRFKFKPNQNKINEIFLWRLFNHHGIKRKLRILAEGSAGSMPNISKKKLLEFAIIVPPIELQNKFAEIVKKIQFKKEALQCSLVELEKLSHSLMQQAFRGELFND